MSYPIISLVGRPNVGKSTLFNRLSNSRQALVSDYEGLTRDRQYANIQLDEECLCTIVDTGGLTNEDSVIDSCLLYTSPSPRDQRGSRMPSSA